jgi:1-acyl-sn-glycerol-3-phosphate acyltransferase
LVTSNHLSYLDILVLAAEAPAVFVSKIEIASWPIFGWFARAAGTVFVERERRTGTGPANERVTGLLRRGRLVILFPEATSSDGQTVLPFRSSLLQPAVTLGCFTTAACLSYSVADGHVGDEICYWGDMHFVSHLMNLLGKKAIHASVSFEPAELGSNRKALARQLHRRVLALHGAMKNEMPIALAIASSSAPSAESTPAIPE